MPLFLSVSPFLHPNTSLSEVAGREVRIISSDYDRSNNNMHVAGCFIFYFLYQGG